MATLNSQSLPAIPPLASAFEHEGIMYCIIPESDWVKFQSDNPLANPTPTLLMDVYQIASEGSKAAYDWIASRNDRDEFRSENKCRFGILQIENGCLPLGKLVFQNGVVCRTIWHFNSKTVLVPTNAIEAMIYGDITGYTNAALYIENFDADLTAYISVIEQIQRWQRSDGIGQLSKLANSAVKLLAGWYHIDRRVHIHKLVEFAISDMLLSLPPMRRSNALIADAYGNQVFEMADIFSFFKRSLRLKC